MRTRDSIGLANWLRIIDAINMVVAFLAALTVIYAQQTSEPMSEILAVRTELHNILIFGLLLMAWSAMLSSLGFYRAGRLDDLDEQAPRLAAGTAAGTFSVFVLGKVFAIELITVEFIFVFWVVASFSLIFSRVLLKLFLAEWRTAGHGIHHAVIIGTNVRAMRLARRIESDRKLGIRVVGFVDDEWDGIHSLKAAGYSVVSNYTDFAQYIRNNVVDDVFICAPMASQYARVAQLLKNL